MNLIELKRRKTEHRIKYMEKWKNSDIGKESLKRAYRKHYDNNKEKYKIKNIISLNKYLTLWEIIIPKTTNCQICDKKIFFNNRDIKNAIHFDHRNGNEKIKSLPTTWLKNRRPTAENIKIWESCNFGMLCQRCNRRLPTLNREDYIKRLINYIRKDIHV